MKVYKLISINQIVSLVRFFPLLGFLLVISLVVTFSQTFTLDQSIQDLGTLWLFSGFIYFQKYSLVISLLVTDILMMSVFRFSSIAADKEGMLVFSSRFFKNKVLRITDIKKIVRKNSSLVGGFVNTQFLFDRVDKVKFITSEDSYTIYILNTDPHVFMSDFPDLQYSTEDFTREKYAYFLIFIIISALFIGLVYYKSFL